MKKKILSQKVDNGYVVVDPETSKSYVVTDEHHLSLVEELGSPTRRQLLKTMGSAALMTPIISSAFLATPAEAASQGVTISITTIANQDVEATVTNPVTGPNPLSVTAATSTITFIFNQTTAMAAPGTFTVSAPMPTMATINQGNNQLFTFDVTPNGGIPSGTYLVAFEFTINTNAGVCTEPESVVVSVP